MDGQTLEYRLSKGLSVSYGVSRDLRTNPRPEPPYISVGCDLEIGSQESVMWIAEAPYHISCCRGRVVLP